MATNIAFKASGFHAYLGDMDVAVVVVKATLCMSNFSGTVNDDEVADLSDLDEMDGGYAGGFAGADRKTLANPTAVRDTAARVDIETGVASTTWPALAPGTRSVEGALIYKHLTSDALSPVICFVDFGTPLAANDQDFIVNWDAGNSQDVLRITFT